WPLLHAVNQAIRNAQDAVLEILRDLRKHAVQQPADATVIRRIAKQNRGLKRSRSRPLNLLRDTRVTQYRFDIREARDHPCVRRVVVDRFPPCPETSVGGIRILKKCRTCQVQRAGFSPRSLGHAAEPAYACSRICGPFSSNSTNSSSVT